MDSFNFTGDIFAKQHQHDLMEEARVERLLQEKKNKDESTWLQRRLRRNHKNK